MNYLDTINEQLKTEGIIINIECDSKNSDTILEHLRHLPGIGIASRKAEIYERLSVKEYLKLYADIDRVKNYTSVIKVMGLSEILNLKCGKLNYSQQKRLEIARAILKNPKIIFVQEPLIDLDESSFNIILQWMSSLNNEKKTVITTSVSLKATLLLPGIPFTLIDNQLQKIQSEDYLDMVQQTPVTFTKISAKVDDKIFLFDPNDISYIEAQNSKTILYVRNSAFQCQFTLEELEVKLKRFGFYRCHRSYLVNMQKVVEVIKWTKNSYSLKLRQLEDMHVPLSKGRMEEMKNLYDL